MCWYPRHNLQYLQNNLLCIVRKLEGGGPVAVAVVVITVFKCFSPFKVKTHISLEKSLLADF